MALEGGIRAPLGTCSSLRCMATSSCFQLILKGRRLLLFWAVEHLLKGSTLKEKNLLLEEQILSFKS